MTAAAAALRRRNRGKLRNLDIGEPIAVTLALFDSPADLGACLKELRSVSGPDLLLLVHLCTSFAGQEMMGLLDLATGMAERVVLVPSPGVSTFIEESLPVAGMPRWPCPVQFEPDPLRAVVGAMQSLLPGQTLAVLWPDTPGLADPSALVALGARWRSSLEAPENGEFHWLPPANDVL